MDYKTMSLKEIESLDVQKISTDNSCCFLWVTQRFLPKSFEILSGWGFKYFKTITWDKANGMCMFGFHNRTEFVVFGYKGLLEPFPKRKAFPTLIAEKSPRHSQKPDTFYNYAGAFGGRCIDVFARHKREGWDAWGDEVSQG